MQFGQIIIEHNIRIIPLEKSWWSGDGDGGQTIPRPFSKTSKLSICLDQQFNVLCSLSLLYAKLRAIEIYSN